MAVDGNQSRVAGRGGLCDIACRLLRVILGGLLLVSVPSCSELGKDEESRTMHFSSGEYSRGYRDGMREAKESLFDDHAGWMWLWMKEKEYADGYDRGWADGRRTLELSKQQKETERRADREADENRQ